MLSLLDAVSLSVVVFVFLVMLSLVEVVSLVMLSILDAVSLSLAVLCPWPG